MYMYILVHTEWYTDSYTVLVIQDSRSFTSSVKTTNTWQKKKPSEKSNHRLVDMHLSNQLRPISTRTIYTIPQIWWIPNNISITVDLSDIGQPTPTDVRCFWLGQPTPTDVRCFWLGQPTPTDVRCFWLGQPTPTDVRCFWLGQPTPTDVRCFWLGQPTPTDVRCFWLGQPTPTDVRCFWLGQPTPTDVRCFWLGHWVILAYWFRKSAQMSLFLFMWFTGGGSAYCTICQ